jgi:phosphoglycolate phosphatase
MPQLTEHIRAIAFDLDGTLIDTMGDLAVAVNVTLGSLNARSLPEESIAALVGNGVEALVHGALKESTGQVPPPEQAAAALALFRRQYARALFKHSRVYPGVREGLSALSELPLSLCCITNKESQFTTPLLEAAGLSAFFTFTLCADRLQDRKPAPSMLLAACSRLSISPAELLYVGDSGLDVVAARAAGSPVIAVTYGYGKARFGERRPDGVAGKLADLPQMFRRSTDARAGLTWMPLGTTP